MQFTAGLTGDAAALARQHGDLLARLKLSVPKKPTKAERELVEQLAKVEKNPREVVGR